MAGTSYSFDHLARAIMIQRDRLYDKRVELLEYGAGVLIIAGFATLGVMLPRLF